MKNNNLRKRITASLVLFLCFVLITRIGITGSPFTLFTLPVWYWIGVGLFSALPLFLGKHGASGLID